MTKIERKEIFLQILENWFNDFSQEINPENCISFYMHFTFSLKFESNISVGDNPDRNFFLKSVLDILNNFDDLIEYGLKPIEFIITKKALEKICEEKPESFNELFSELFEIYNIAKNEFLCK